MRSIIKNTLNLFVPNKPPNPTQGAGNARRLPLRDIERDDIPRYPPFIRGFPTVEVFHLLEMQAELIDKIRSSLGMSHESFNEILLPVIENLAAFVHLLPASEAHHHKGAGGLFRHALETSLYSARASKGPIFAVDGTPKFRRDTEPLWRLACAIAGLLHDIGKPLTDMIVTNKDGSQVWSPHLHPTLHEWLITNNIDRYFLRWNAARHKEHESAAHLVFNDLVPRHVRAHLSTPDARVFKQLSDAVLIQSRIGNKIAGMMSLGDRTSVAADMKNHNIDMDQFAHGIPVERYVFDAIRRLVNSGRWKVNEHGGKVWHLHDGTFIAWRELGDLHALLDEDEIPGIPRDPATLADVLIDGGFCEPQILKVEGEERRRRYWDVKPEGVPSKLEMLRFNSHTYVFTTEPPAAINGVVEGFECARRDATLVINQDTGEILNHRELSRDDDTVNDGADTITSVNGENNTDGSDNTVVQSSEPASKASPPKPSETETSSDLNSIGVSSALSMFAATPTESAGDVNKGSGEQSSSAPAQDTPAQKPPQSTSKAEAEKRPEPTKPPPPQAKPGPDTPAISGIPGGIIKPKEGLPSKKTTAPDNSHASFLQAGKTNDKPTAPAGTPATALEDTLKEFPNAAKHLKSLLDADKAGALASTGASLAIPFPAGIRLLGEQDDVMKALKQDGAIDLDPVMPGIGVRKVQGQNCVILTQELSAALLEALNAAGQEAPPLGPTPANVKVKAKKTKQNIVKARPVKPVKPVEPEAITEPAKKKTSPPKSEPPEPTTKTEKEPRQNFMPGKPSKPKREPVEPAHAEPAVQVSERTKEDLQRLIHEQRAPQERTPEREMEVEALREKNPTVDDVIKRLINMMLSGEGPWLAGPVIRRGNALEVCIKTLDKIKDSHPQHGKRSMELVMRRYGLNARNGVIQLKEPVKNKGRSIDNVNEA